MSSIPGEALRSYSLTSGGGRADEHQYYRLSNEGIIFTSNILKEIRKIIKDDHRVGRS